MPPYTSKLVIAHVFVATHPEGIGDFPLLLDGKQYIALDAKDECGYPREPLETLGQFREMGRWVEGRWVRFRVGGLSLAELSEVGAGRR